MWNYVAAALKSNARWKMHQHGENWERKKKANDPEAKYAVMINLVCSFPFRTIFFRTLSISVIFLTAENLKCREWSGKAIYETGGARERKLLCFVIKEEKWKMFCRKSEADHTKKKDYSKARHSVPHENSFFIISRRCCTAPRLFTFNYALVWLKINVVYVE